MKFVDRLKFAFSNNFNEYIKAFMRGDDIEGLGMNIDRETALKYSAVFACSRVLSETLASLPIFLYRRGKDRSKEEANDIPLYDILHYEPNSEMSPFNFKESLMMNLCLGGNGLAQKVYNKSTIPELLYLIPVDYDLVEIKRNKDTKALEYIYKPGTDQQKTLNRQQMFHIPGLGINGITGLTPIQYAAKAIELGLTYETFGVNFYKNGANTNMALRHPGTLKEEARKRLKEQVEEKVTGLKNVNRPWLLEEGMEVKELTINPVDAQLLESKYFQLEDICRFYRVPQHLIQKLDRSTNNNIEHQGLEFVIYTMLPWIKRWEENINLQLMTKQQRQAGYFAEFKVDALLRGDIKSRYEAYAQGRLNGFLSANDIRRLENMNPIANGDIYLQPLNYADVTIANEIQLKNKQSDQVKAMTEEIYKLLAERK